MPSASPLDLKMLIRGIRTELSYPVRALLKQLLLQGLLPSQHGIPMSRVTLVPEVPDLASPDDHIQVRRFHEVGHDPIRVVPHAFPRSSEQT